MTMLAQFAATGGGGPAVYVEDVFSTYLYNGNGATQTITNDIDLSGEGGLVWGKRRNSTGNNFLVDTVRGSNKVLISDDTTGQITSSVTVTGFNSNGFGIGAGDAVDCNNSGGTYTSWTFREQAKFFDIVTYTGDGTSGRTIAHNLGATPGCMIVKRMDNVTDWRVYHRSLGATKSLFLNDPSAAVTQSAIWNDTAPTSTVFTLGNSSAVNLSGGTYVAYLFAHDAGGFGLNGTDNVVSCGSFVSGSGGTCPPVNLGYEPQWVLYKNVTTGEVWRLADVLRGWNQTQTVFLNPNSTAAEGALSTNPSYFCPTATGFQSFTPGLFTAGDTFIYIAIRRGPMKVPTDATKVFLPSTYTGTGATAQITGVPFAPDTLYSPGRGPSGSTDRGWFDRLRGINNPLQTNATGAEDPTYTGTVTAYNSNGVSFGGSYSFVNSSGSNYIEYFFGRAAGFFDVVCYTGTYTATTFTHNLAAVPELMIVKGRNPGTQWSVYSATVGPTGLLVLNTSAAADTAPGRGAYWNSTAPTASVFSLGADGDVNNSGDKYVNYLFATCPGVSKVGTYTGTGTTKQVDCGFTAGARFVMIKRTDSTGDWYVWDSARGIVGGNDPYLFVNTATAEVTSTDYVDTYAAGFELSSTAPAAINSSGGTYIFLAIA